MPPRIGITGHMDLTQPTAALVGAAVRALLAQEGRGFAGISCLARGADQIFARAVLDLGGTLIAVLPSPNYREHQVAPDDRAEFDTLLGASAEVHCLPFPQPGEAAYAAANAALLDRADKLVAVWDGRPGRDRGGAAAMVGRARQLGKPVHVVWPAGAARLMLPP